MPRYDTAVLYPAQGNPARNPENPHGFYQVSSSLRENQQGPGVGQLEGVQRQVQDAVIDGSIAPPT